jgi:myo-inositol-1(or 4)-monophosphatase
LDWQQHCDVAERAARRAGHILTDMAGSVSVHEKGRGDLVTSADLASQEAIRETLLGAFPSHSFLGEESAPPTPVSSPRGDRDGSEGWEFRWIVDPLDGTSNYVHGLEFYAVSIGLEHRGELVVGVIYEPTSDRCFHATVGGGAFLNRSAIRVSPVSSLRSALLVTGFPPGMRGRADLLRLFEEFCSECHSVRRLGSAALDLAYVASGRFDGFYAPNLHPWDAAAGLVILREAGGKVSNLDGSTYNLYTPDILASNGTIHDAMTQVAARVLTGDRHTVVGNR